MNGLVTLQSSFTVHETINHFISIIESKGMTVFLRLDHADNAGNVGLTLRPTELIIFGNPRAGTVLMQDKQTAGIDLPVKALAWEDEDGKVWLTYNDIKWISERHGLSDKSGNVVNAIEDGMRLVSNLATRSRKASPN